jgi:hypothetical protein
LKSRGNVFIGWLMPSTRFYELRVHKTKQTYGDLQI